jgi:hypothetical protein
LWRDNVEALLAPERVDFRIRGALGRSTAPAGSFACDPASGSRPWQSALAALGDAIEIQRPRRTRLDLVLSDRFAYYLVLPPRDGIATRDDWRAYARSRMKASYGELASAWNLRIEVVSPGRESLACAVSEDLLADLRDLMQRCGCRLASVRTHFLSNWVQRRSHWQRHDQVWLALIESHHVCLGVYRHGHWIAIRNESTPDGWAKELPAIVRRIQCTIDTPGEGELHLCGEHGDLPPPDSIEGLPVRVLQARPVRSNPLAALARA